MEVMIHNEAELQGFGQKLGAALRGGEAIELVGDVGAGKTTLTKAVAAGMGVEDDVSSPSYTLSQVYEAPSGLRLVHYDFYRLNDPGILAGELQEALAETENVVVVEWADIVENILPPDHLRVRIEPTNETARRLTLSAGGDKSRQLLERFA